MIDIVCPDVKRAPLISRAEEEGTRPTHRREVIALLNIPGVVKFTVEAPSGDLITPANAGPLGATFSDSGTMQFYRYGLPVPIGPGQQSGQWHAVLEVDRAKFARHLEKIRQEDPKAFAQAIAHGVHYSVNVHAWSNVRMKTRIDQDGVLPGSTMFLRATLTEYGAPIDHRAVVRAELTRPDGSQVVLSLVETEAGVFETALTAAAVGVYRFRFLGEGSTLRGRPFTREALATGAITSSEVVTTIGERPDDTLCRFLDCLLKKDTLGAFFRKHEIDADAVHKCVRVFCDPKRVGRPR